MQYSILCYDDEIETWDRAWRQEPSGGEWSKPGVLIQLLPTATAVTFRQPHAGRSVVIDGPYAATSKQLLGIYLVDCVSIAEAVDFARECARGCRGASFEIRPTGEAFLGTRVLGTNK
jgi:hypothetical protein